MGFFDSLFGSSTPQVEVRVSRRLRKFLEFGKWEVTNDNGRPRPRVLVRNISKRALGHSMLHYSAFSAADVKLVTPTVNMPYLEPGECGELALPFSTLSDEQVLLTAYVVVDIDQMYDEDDEEDNNEFAEEGEEEEEEKEQEVSWYARRGKKTVGPLSSEALMKMASEGKLKPTDELRLGESGEWFEASRLDGLFP